MFRVRGRPNTILAHWPGSYVNALTIAESVACARSHIATAAQRDLDADVVRIEFVRPGNPDEWDLCDEDKFDEIIDSEDIAEPSGIGVRQEFDTHGHVMFGTPFTWKPRKWWQIWR